MQSEASDYIQVEYIEATTAYHKGVAIAYTTLKGYLAANGLLLGVMSALLTVSSDNKLPSTVYLLSLFFNYAIPVFAIILSVIMFLSIPHYGKHLDNCSDRAAELEDRFEGKLFSRLKSISETGKFNTLSALRGIAIMFMLFWISFPLFRLM